LSERPLTTKGENRRDLPLGVGTSVSLHVVAAICIFFAAAAFIVSGQPAFSPQNARTVIIQTLTRTPHIVTRLHPLVRPVHQEKPIRIGVSRPTRVHRMVEHTRGAMAAQTAAQGHASAPASAARPQQPQTASGSAASATAVTASANGTAASGTSGAGGSGPGGSGDSAPQNGGGSVWTDKPASGGTLGDKIPDATRPYCTPGRGGFLNRS
jgi:hypothetical protein